jgi:O-antigen/teichoic acid export membrane protein
MSGTLAAQVATVAALPILSRIFSPASFGEYAIYISATTLLVVLATLRYEMAIVLPRSEREAAAIKKLGNLLVILSCGAITAVTISFVLVSHSLEQNWRWLVILIGPGTLLLGLNAMLSYWVMRTDRFAALSAARLTQALVTAFAQIVIGLVGGNLATGLIAGLLIGQFAALMVMSLVDSSRAYRRDPRGVRGWSYLLRKHWRLPAMTTPQSILDSLQMNGINFAIGYFSFSALGQYSQAWRLVSFPVGLIGSTLGQVYYPELTNTSRHDLPRIVRRTIGKTLVVGIVPFALIFALSPTVIPWLLGDQWALSGKYAQALTPWLYLTLAASPMSSVFIVLNKQKIGLLYSVFYATIPIAVLLLLREDLYIAIWGLSLAKTVMLIGNLCMVLWLVRWTTPSRR